MPSLVEELQRDALNGTVPSSDLLRKALVVATKLNLVEFRIWVECELEGYPAGDVPEYRQTSGQVYFFNPVTGPRPVLFPDREIAEGLSSYDYHEAIGLIEELASADDSCELVVPFSANAQRLLLAQYQIKPGLPQLHISRMSAVAIVHAIRNIILKWSLKLEQDGILGDGLSFSSEEKQKAAKEATTLGNPILFIVNSAIQHNSPGASQRSQHG